MSISTVKCSYIVSCIYSCLYIFYMIYEINEDQNQWYNILDINFNVDC